MIDILTFALAHGLGKIFFLLFFGNKIKMQDDTAGSSSAGGAVGTYAYMAPELLDDDSDSTSDEDGGGGGGSGGGGGGAAGGDDKQQLDRAKADVYALGIVVYETFVRKVPFQGVSFPKIFKRVVKKEERPGEIPAAASRSIQEIIRLSWAQNPRHRPHAKQISSLLTLELEAMARASGAALPPSPSVAAEARSPPQPPSRTPNAEVRFPFLKNA
jgi:serine/threonine protein kinase